MQIAELWRAAADALSSHDAPLQAAIGEVNDTTWTGAGGALYRGRLTELRAHTVEPAFALRDAAGELALLAEALRAHEQRLEDLDDQSLTLQRRIEELEDAADAESSAAAAAGSPDPGPTPETEQELLRANRDVEVVEADAAAAFGDAEAAIATASTNLGHIASSLVGGTEARAGLFDDFSHALDLFNATHAITVLSRYGWFAIRGRAVQYSGYLARGLGAQNLGRHLIAVGSGGVGGATRWVVPKLGATPPGAALELGAGAILAWYYLDESQPLGNQPAEFYEHAGKTTFAVGSAVTAAGLVAAGVVTGTTVVAAASAAVITVGAGFAIAEGANWLTEKATGRSISDRWVDATVGSELDAMAAQDEPLSPEQSARLQELQTPMGALKALVGL